MAQAFYPPPYYSGGQPSDDGIHELAASSRHSPTITRWLVVSYTTFSPLPLRRKAVLFFCRHLLSPIASTFGSGAPYAARTFLSRDLSEAPATNRSSAFSGCKGKDIFAKKSRNCQKLPKIIILIAYLQLKT